MTGTGWILPSSAPGEWLPALDIPEPDRQRRLTVLLRLLLLIPQFIVVFLLGIVALVMVVIGWFAALVLGRLPDPVCEFLAGYLGYSTRVNASTMLLVDRYPPFTLDAPPDYPVQLELRAGPLNRLAVFFRLLLIIPAAIVGSLVTAGWYALAFFFWLLVLVLGRMPRPLFEATAATLRYEMRVRAYGLLLTPAYPKRLFGDDLPQDTLTGPRSATRPLLLGGPAKALVVAFLVLGLLGYIASSFGSPRSEENADAHGTPAATLSVQHRALPWPAADSTPVGR
ncbi:DUF4389 domain-containing protein [Saccharothrix sp. ST-888]|uniref:DUF4389 domain-containing protein n=1 Tax=Saccharothrix sp. ST-888 TaxID=1427391 RepID=UPI0007C70B03|nr:DUF4389 domain-containing protein [Saccharothrix sp. ST-888]